MTALPPESTARFWLDYNDAVNDHTLLMRYPDGAGLSGIQGVMADFLTAIEPTLHAITVIGARWAALGSTVSIPTTWLGSPVYGVGVHPVVSGPLELCYVGRTTGGRMAKWFVYGTKLGVPDSYRFFPGDNADLDAGDLVLRSAGLAGSLLAIDGLGPSVYPYINIQFNSYWETQSRR